MLAFKVRVASSLSPSQLVTPSLPRLLACGADAAVVIVWLLWLLQILIGIHGLAALGLVGGFGSLLVFHVYLMARGLSTYDWVINKYAKASAAGPVMPAARGASSSQPSSL
jgi:hypothetical protein